MVAIHGEGQFLLPLQNRVFSPKLHHYISNLLLDEESAYEQFCPKEKIIYSRFIRNMFHILFRKVVKL